ncbi:hypothetical protein PR002_g2194 [Phytophthora rubi]|uniref:Uncharacterized protein n=1 Tax=Phytophthora rubi TaxID=129364 RepID=A0A6A3NW60_9STRA|nr:hypothetical protein PR002_g2194 [Phytophthora rubi]
MMHEVRRREDDGGVVSGWGGGGGGRCVSRYVSLCGHRVDRLACSGGRPNEASGGGVIATGVVLEALVVANDEDFVTIAETKQLDGVVGLCWVD